MGRRRIVLALPVLASCTFAGMVVLVGQSIRAPLDQHQRVIRETETKLEKVEEQLHTADETVEQIALQLNEG